MQQSSRQKVIVLGIGAFAHGCLRILREGGAEVAAYLTRDYGHYGPRLEAACRDRIDFPNPVPWLLEQQPDLVIPMSIDWALQAWTSSFLASGLPFLCATGEGLRLERERDFARALCERVGIPFPRAHFASDRAAAEAWVKAEGRPFVIKNPLCSPTSPIHTIVCESQQDTLAWLPRLDDAEGVFLQEYMGRCEAGHIALVSGGEIYPLVTNQEYKRAHDGNLGIVAGAPMGGLVERDTEDRYGLVAELLEPLRPWFRAVGFHGPVQVTGIRHQGRWHVLEYNVRLGITSGVMILRMLANPGSLLEACARNQPLAPAWREGLRYGCGLTLAGFGYPYTQLVGPSVPVVVDGEPDCDVWWNEVEAAPDGGIQTTGHRLCDVCALAPTLEAAIALAYRNIRRIHSLGAYYRTDVGRSLWPPGSA
ncbi:MAG: phosphoribosylglycinamide synthetase C domain-containing protein [Steroidobacteraceae bacterium]